MGLQRIGLHVQIDDIALFVLHFGRCEGLREGIRLEVV
jgi:hypothetical protein